MSSPEEQVRGAIATQAAEWFVAHRAGELPESRREAFMDWLRASPAHAREYLALTGLAEDLASVAKQFSASTDTLLARSRLEGDGVRQLFSSLPSRSPRRSLQPLFAALGATTMMLAIFTVIWWTGSAPDYTTAHAEQRFWRLPDGSTVHLNSDSEIQVRFDAQRRQVDLLKGQAVFSVAKDMARPFWVNAGVVAVKALGTKFDVYRQSGHALISVIEGRVAVWNTAEADAPPVAQVDAGQQARVTDREVVVANEANNVRKAVAWLQRQVIFDHDALGSAVQEFNRYNELQIHVDEALRAVEVSGIFSAYDADSFVSFLERQPGMHVQRQGVAVVVSAK